MSSGDGDGWFLFVVLLLKHVSQDGRQYVAHMSQRFSV